jgi:hypothetical protein
VDYRELLWKYIRHVEREEGVTFIDALDFEWEGTPLWERLQLTEAERDELVRLDRMSIYVPLPDQVVARSTRNVDSS